ncbi:MAG: GNAT family N-acetyltransferase [Rhodobiaceae bacterium]|nr:MAG: GNAT family N-acetyltransferase [Rhodobiaceae bacterium]
MPGRRLHLPITTERLVLRDLRTGDLDAMHAYASHKDVTRFLFWGPNELEDTCGSLSAFIAAQAETPRIIYELGLTLGEDERLLGALCLYRGDHETRNDAEIGFVLHPDCWGQGYVTEAAQALMSAGFTDLELHRIWATCDARNGASVRVLEKLGMQREATFRSSRKVAEGWVDEHSYAVLRAEFT